MEIFYLVGGFITIMFIVSLIEWINEKYKISIRDNALRNIQKKYTIQLYIDNYRSKLSEFYFNKENGYLKKYFIAKNIKLVGEFKNFLNDCPLCNDGRLKTRKGKYGAFIGCSNFPNCRYTENIQNVKGEYKIYVKNQIIDDIQKAYN